ncbi:PREDICTED: 17.6 kDa class II heat shock protein-like [Tarenaya hassleriana]|uniref:17.6 kDa class II heat shock protein-like n=1 Tax=Tarenaya hassleriana TaxID=28532 RepID=UPI00053C5DF3|nr:PREDICTED: 17.6 kDa class II heat shock protein-like [Tarenaya hassleriana]
MHAQHRLGAKTYSKKHQKAMDFGRMMMESPIFTILEDMLDVPEEHEKTRSNPSRAYVRDAKAMAATPADVIEHQNAYAFVVDMPGIKPEDVKVQVENENVLVVSGERQREKKEEKEKEKEKKESGVKYLRMERRMGKFLRKFQLPENANLEKITAVCNDGVLKVTVEKLPPPEPKKPKTIQVQVA